MKNVPSKTTMKNVPTKTAGGKHPLPWININKNDVWNRTHDNYKKNQESQAKSKMAKLEEHHE